MSSENEILRSRLRDQEHQLQLLRAALSGREALLNMPTDDIDGRWLVAFKKQLREQATLEVKAVAGGTEPALPRADIAFDMRVEASNSKSTPTVSMQPVMQLDDLPIASDKYAETLLNTTKQLLDVWQGALRERYHALLSQLFDSFTTFKKSPKDHSLQTFLAVVNDLHPEAELLMHENNDDSFSGPDGNPFETDAEGIAAYFKGVMDQHTNDCLISRKEDIYKEVKETVSKLERELESWKTKHSELEAANKKCLLQRDTLSNDVAQWKHKYEMEKQKAPAVERKSEMPSVVAAPRPMANKKRIGELRAALSHFEVQLAASCYNSHGSEQRHSNLRRRMEAVRTELQREESLL